MCYIIVALVLVGIGVVVYFLISSGVFSGLGKMKGASSFLGDIKTDTTSFIEIVEKGRSELGTPRGAFMEVSPHAELS